MACYLELDTIPEYLDALGEPLPVFLQKKANELRKENDTLVEQAALVSEELIRTSILWHEMWHAALEEASRLYFSQQDVQGMLDALTPLHLALERGPQTASELSF